MNHNYIDVKPAILAALRRIDTPTVSTAVAKYLKRPEEYYTDHTVRLMLPELGAYIGYAVTIEVTTNDEDSPALSFYDHYRFMESLKKPLIAVFRDIDSRPGRGACFGEGMSVLHRKCGAVGMIAEGTVRDLAGLRQRKFPAMAWGTTPGHGRFKPIRMNVPVTVGGMRITPGDLLLVDENGCVKIPAAHAEEILAGSRAMLAKEKKLFPMFAREPLSEIAKHMTWDKR